MKMLAISLLLFGFNSKAEVCKSLVSEILTQEGNGTFERPKINKSQTESEYIFGGFTKKSNYLLSVSKLDSKIVRTIKTGPNSFETSTLVLSDSCKVKIAIHENSSKGRVELTSDFCSKYQRRKLLLTQKDYKNPSSELLSNSKIKGYPPIMAFKGCDELEGKFEGTIKRPKPNKDGLCTPPYVASLYTESCEPPACPPGTELLEDVRLAGGMICSKIQGLKFHSTESDQSQSGSTSGK